MGGGPCGSLPGSSGPAPAAHTVRLPAALCPAGELSPGMWQRPQAAQLTLSPRVRGLSQLLSGYMAAPAKTGALLVRCSRLASRT